VADVSITAARKPMDGDGSCGYRSIDYFSETPVGGHGLRVLLAKYLLQLDPGTEISWTTSGHFVKEQGDTEEKGRGKAKDKERDKKRTGDIRNLTT
jgi:hypothetical protein